MYEIYLQLKIHKSCRKTSQGLVACTKSSVGSIYINTKRSESTPSNYPEVELYQEKIHYQHCISNLCFNFNRIAQTIIAITRVFFPPYDHVKINARKKKLLRFNNKQVMSLFSC